MTNQEARNLYIAINSLFGPQYNLPKKFAFRAALNSNMLKPVVEALDKATASENVPELAAYNAELRPIIDKYCIRDDKGQPVIVNNLYTFTEEGEQAIVNMRSNHPDIDDKFTQHNTEVNKIMQEDCTVELKKVQEEDLPDTVPGHLIMALMTMVNS